jgi:hypothetical protein
VVVVAVEEEEEEEEEEELVGMVRASSISIDIICLRFYR